MYIADLNGVQRAIESINEDMRQISSTNMTSPDMTAGSRTPAIFPGPPSNHGSTQLAKPAASLASFQGWYHGAPGLPAWTAPTVVRPTAGQTGGSTTSLWPTPAQAGDALPSNQYMGRTAAFGGGSSEVIREVLYNPWKPPMNPHSGLAAKTIMMYTPASPEKPSSSQQGALISPSQYQEFLPNSLMRVGVEGSGARGAEDGRDDGEVVGDGEGGEGEDSDVEGDEEQDGEDGDGDEADDMSNEGDEEAEDDGEEEGEEGEEGEGEEEEEDTDVDEDGIPLLEDPSADIRVSGPYWTSTRRLIRLF